MNYSFFRLVERKYELTEDDRKLLDQLHKLKRGVQHISMVITALVLLGLFVLAVCAAVRFGL